MTAPDPSEQIDQLAQEFIARQRAGELPTIDEYAERHPELASDIRELFPVLALVEGVKDPAAGEDDRTPERIATFEIVGELGRGGMGRVYEARDGDGHVALKVMHPHLGSDQNYLSRFLDEAEVGRRVNDPHVVRTLGAGVTQQHGIEVPYLVMELVRGQNLRDLIAEVGAVGDRLARHIGWCVAKGLAAVHAQGIVHRDIKPENVIITDDEVVKIMDLGIALVRDRAMAISQSGQFVGSLLYTAPEQIRGQDVDERTDLYALGLTLYELCSGTHALKASTSDGGGLDARPHTADLPRTGVTRFLEALVRQLLEPKPRDRPDSAADVAGWLERGEASRWWREQADKERAIFSQIASLHVMRHGSFVGRAQCTRVARRAPA